MTSLEYYQCQVQVLRDLTTHLPVLEVGKENYIYFNAAAKGLEIIAELPYTMSLETVNLLNSAYAANKIFTVPQTGKTYLFSFHAAKENTQSIKSLLYVYFSFTTTKEILQRTYADLIC